MVDNSSLYSVLRIRIKNSVADLALGVLYLVTCIRILRRAKNKQINKNLIFYLKVTLRFVNFLTIRKPKLKDFS